MHKLNAKGEAYKALIVKQLELEYWSMISAIQNRNQCSIADAIRIVLRESGGLSGTTK